MSTANTDAGRIPVKRALVSVYDKTGLEDLARGLHDAGVELVSTGGSAALIEKLGIPVTKVEDLTGFPECLDGRVKTLHPKVHAGILADLRLEDHRNQLTDYENLADDLGVEPGELGLAWLLHRPGITAPIIGPRTADQFDSAVRAVELKLEQGVLDRLDEIFPGYKTAPEDYAW